MSIDTEMEKKNCVIKTMECSGEKKVCPFFLLENSRPLSPWGPLDFLSTYLGIDFVNTKGTFHAKMVTIKDRNSMDLTEAEDIKKRWQEYTKELYKKRCS